MVLLYIFHVYYNITVQSNKELQWTSVLVPELDDEVSTLVLTESSSSWRTLVRPEGEYTQGCIWPQGCGVRLTGSGRLRLSTPFLLLSPEGTYVLTSRLMRDLLCIRSLPRAYCLLAPLACLLAPLVCLLAPLAHVLQECLGVGWCTLWSIVVWLGVSPVSVVVSDHVAR